MSSRIKKENMEEQVFEEIILESYSKINEKLNHDYKQIRKHQAK